MILFLFSFRAMHLYLSNDFMSLRKLLLEYDDQTKFNYSNMEDQLGVNMWLIHTTSNQSRIQLAESLKVSPLRLDSQLYEFHEQIGGNRICY